MCDRCEDLQEEIRFLKRELGLVRDADQETRLRQVFGITPKEAAVLGLLYARPGRAVSKSVIWDLLYSAQRREPEMKVIDVYAAKLRRRLGSDAIETVYGAGYRLAETCREQCAKAFATAPSDVKPLPPPQWRTGLADGSRAAVPILLALLTGPKTTPELRKNLLQRQWGHASALACDQEKRGRIIRRPGSGTSRLNPAVWKLTRKGREYLATFEKTKTLKVAA